MNTKLKYWPSLIEFKFKTKQKIKLILIPTRHLYCTSDYLILKKIEFILLTRYYVIIQLKMKISFYELYA